MRKILCTFPGKHGDSLWALPTVRAIAEAAGGPVDLLMAPKYAGICELYKSQPYIRDAGSWLHWQVQEGAPMTPWSPFEETLHHEAIKMGDLQAAVTARYDQVIHLGYRTWPPLALPYYVDLIARQDYGLSLPPLDLDRPWITVPAKWDDSSWGDVVCGWSDEHFELKHGITDLVFHGRPEEETTVLAGAGSRWVTEAGWTASTWIEAAEAIASAKVFLGCCSALHVIAAATGTKAVIMEPAEARHHPVFWPYGYDGRVRLVRGGDGKWTFDARHVADCVREALA